MLRILPIVAALAVLSIAGSALASTRTRLVGHGLVLAAPAAAASLSHPGNAIGVVALKL